MNVSVDVPEILAGLKVTPVGKPDAVKEMLPVKPPEGVTVRVSVPVEPAATVALLAERVKLGVAVPEPPEGVSVNWDWKMPLPLVVLPELAVRAVRKKVTFPALADGGVQLKFQEGEPKLLASISAPETVVPVPAVNVPSAVDRLLASRAVRINE